MIFSTVCTTESKHSSVGDSLPKTHISIRRDWEVVCESVHATSFLFSYLFFILGLYSCCLPEWNCYSYYSNVIMNYVSAVPVCTGGPGLTAASEESHGRCNFCVCWGTFFGLYLNQMKMEGTLISSAPVAGYKPLFRQTVEGEGVIRG